MRKAGDYKDVKPYKKKILVKHLPKKYVGAIQLLTDINEFNIFTIEKIGEDVDNIHLQTGLTVLVRKMNKAKRVNPDVSMDNENTHFLINQEDVLGVIFSHGDKKELSVVGLRGERRYIVEREIQEQQLASGIFVPSEVPITDQSKWCRVVSRGLLNLNEHFKFPRLGMGDRVLLRDWDNLQYEISYQNHYMLSVREDDIIAIDYSEHIQEGKTNVI